jgi:hypothetical protein
MESKIFQVPATIEKIETMTHGLRLRIDTQENLNPESMSVLLSNYNKLGWFTFNVHQIEADDIVNLPPLKKSEGKSKAQIMRGVLYRVWERDNEGMEDFELYYDVKMDKFINHLKDKYLA